MSQTVLESMGWGLLHLLWQGALVAAALALALKGLARRTANVRYLLACGTLALMLVLPALTGWRHYTSSLPPSVSRVEPLSAARTPRAPAPATALALAPNPPPSLERALSFLGAHLRWLVLAWGLGVTVSSLRLLSGWLRLRRLVREAQPAPPGWQEALERLAGRLELTRAVRLLQSTGLNAPAAVGWLRPVVLLPVSALTGLPPRQLEMVLAHELAHIRRYDFAVNLVQTLVETLLFYHPAVWWMSRVIRAEREHCCDDIAVGTSGNPVSYARALTALESLRVLPRGAAAGPALSALGGSLTERVRRLVGSPAARFPSRCIPMASVLTLMSGLAVAAPLAALVTPSLPAPAFEAPAVQAPGFPEVPATAVLAAAQPTAAAPATAAPSMAGGKAKAATPAHAPATAATPATAPTPAAAPAPTPKRGPAADKSKEGGENKEGDKDDEEDTTRVGAQQLSVDQLVALKSAGVTPEKVKELESLGYEPTVGNLVQFGHAQVTPGYVKQMSAALGRKPTANELVEMKHLGVTPERVQALKAAGYANLKPDELTQAAALGVDERFLRELKDAGYSAVPFEELVQLRALGVDGKYVEELKSLGYVKVPADELAQLKAMGISAEYVRALRAAGLQATPEELVQLRAVGVNADFVRKLRDQGLDKVSVDELIRLRTSGVDADFIRGLRKSGK